MKPPQDTSPESWHRFFGASANNRAWQLAGLPAEQVDPCELLDAAHAAAWHWKAIGTELQRKRAAMLLAQAHAQAGLGATALAYAQEMRSYFLTTPGTPDWELAFVHLVHAHAARAAGAGSEHASSYAEAVKAVAAIADPEDRAIVERVFRQVPAPLTAIGREAHCRRGRGDRTEACKEPRMNRIARCVDVLVACAVPALAFAAELSERSLRAADEEQMRIIVQGDAKAQQKFMHPNYIINGPSNKVLRKPVLVDMLAHGKMASDRFERVIEGLAITGNVGIVMGREVVHPLPDSQLGSLHGDRTLNRRFTNVFLFEDGRWLFLARHATIVD